MIPMFLEPITYSNIIGKPMDIEKKTRSKTVVKRTKNKMKQKLYTRKKV